MWLTILVSTAGAAPGQASWTYPGAQALDAGHGWVGAAGFALPSLGAGGGVVGMLAATDEVAFGFALVGAGGEYQDTSGAGALTARWVPLDEPHVRLGLMGGAARAVSEYDEISLAMTGIVLDAGGEHFRFDASIPFTMTEWRDGEVYVFTPFNAPETVPAFGFTHRFDERNRVRLGGLVPTLTYQHASRRFFVDLGLVVIAPLVRAGWVF